MAATMAEQSQSMLLADNQAFRVDMIGRRNPEIGRHGADKASGPDPAGEEARRKVAPFPFRTYRDLQSALQGNSEPGKHALPLEQFRQGHLDESIVADLPLLQLRRAWRAKVP